VTATDPAGAQFRARIHLPQGIDEPALAFPLSRARQTASAAFFLAAGVGAIVFGATGAVVNSFLRILGDAGPPLMVALGIYLVAGGFAATSRWREEPMVALSPSGIVIRWLGSATFVPWDSISAVSSAKSAMPLSRVIVTRLGVSPSSAIVRRGLGWILSGEGVFGGGEVKVPVQGLRIAPDEFEAMVRLYAAQPERRHDLSLAASPVSNDLG
jgi:hypothetical protein